MHLSPVVPDSHRDNHGQTWHVAGLCITRLTATCRDAGPQGIPGHLFFSAESVLFQIAWFFPGAPAGPERRRMEMWALGVTPGVRPTLRERRT